MMNSSMSSGMWVFMSLLMVLTLALLLGFGIWAVRRFNDRDRSSHARAILEERFARGEIDHDEFDRRMRAFGGEPGMSS